MVGQGDIVTKDRSVQGGSENHGGGVTIIHLGLNAGVDHGKLPERNIGRQVGGLEEAVVPRIGSRQAHGDTHGDSVAHRVRSKNSGRVVVQVYHIVRLHSGQGRPTDARRRLLVILLVGGHRAGHGQVLRIDGHDHPGHRIQRVVAAIRARQADAGDGHRLVGAHQLVRHATHCRARDLHDIRPHHPAQTAPADHHVRGGIVNPVRSRHADDLEGQWRDIGGKVCRLGQGVVAGRQPAQGHGRGHGDVCAGLALGEGSRGRVQEGDGGDVVRLHPDELGTLDLRRIGAVVNLAQGHRVGDRQRLQHNLSGQNRLGQGVVRSVGSRQAVSANQHRLVGSDLAIREEDLDVVRVQGDIVPAHVPLQAAA